MSSDQIERVIEACRGFSGGFSPDREKISSNIGRGFLRFSATGKRDDTSLSLKVFDAGDCLVCYLKDYRSGRELRFSTREAGSRTTMTPEEIRLARQQREELEQRNRDREQRRRVRLRPRARRLWDKGKAPDTYRKQHLYLGGKNIPPINVRRLKSKKRDVLLLPMIDLHVGLASLYLIYPNGFKRPLLGTVKRGLCLPIGAPLNNPAGVWFCEGWATGVSLHLEVKAPVLVCFDTNGLAPVIDVFSKKYPHVPLFLCCDHDRKTFRKNGDNPGVRYGLKVKEQFPQVTLYVPTIPDDAPEWVSDINDLVNWRRMQEATR